MALWPCGLKLYKANELGDILAVCLNPRDLDWWTASGTLDCFDLTNESLLSYQAYAVVPILWSSLIIQAATVQMINST